MGSLLLVTCLFICYAGIWVCFVLTADWLGGMMLMVTGCMIVFVCYGYAVIVMLFCCVVLCLLLAFLDVLIFIVLVWCLVCFGDCV